VVAVSQEIAEHLATVLGFPSERICVIHNGIVLPHTAPATAPEHSLRSHEPAPHIGNVGRFVPVKDHALFLEVAARLRQLIPAARFSILGDGPLREALELRSTELGLDDHIRFIPPCNDPSSYYRSLDLYLNTSQHEGIPLSILEAMAHGIPVVAPRVGGLPEILSNGQGGNLIPERLPDAFARRCVAILTDPAVYQTCAREAVTIVRERFTIGQTAMAYASLYESLLQSRSGQRPFPV
jgi:glycosyltransferase involved in cell wall biosynthesis